MKTFLLVCLFLVTPSLSAVAGEPEIRLITWETEIAADPSILPENRRDLLPLAQFAVKSASSELELFQAGGGSAAMLLGLPPEKSKQLSETLSLYCSELIQSPVFRKAPSALAYCCSPTKPKRGLASLYLPKEISPETKRIIFLHGYGGSLLPLLAPIIEANSEAIVLAPAFGISGGAISGEYIDEALKTMSKLEALKSIQFEGKPLLMGLSAGAFAGFEIIRGNADSFYGFICLGAYPKKPLRRTDSVIRILCGAEEPFVKNGTLHRQTRSANRATTRIKLIDGADHFFLLEEKAKTTAILSEWVNDIFDSKNP